MYYAANNTFSGIFSKNYDLVNFCMVIPLFILKTDIDGTTINDQVILKPCFQRPFRCIFNLSKHISSPKSGKLKGNVVSTKASALIDRKQFLGQFQLILVREGFLKISTNST